MDPEMRKFENAFKRAARMVAKVAASDVSEYDSGGHVAKVWRAVQRLDLRPAIRGNEAAYARCDALKRAMRAAEEQWRQNVQTARAAALARLNDQIREERRAAFRSYGGSR
jgi:acyl-CoA reductase-like NAD-dependent aldehyde dehydrogenase